MPVFIANIAEFDAAYAKVIEDDFESTHDFPDEMGHYQSHLFSMFAAEMVQKSKGELSDSVFRFFATIFWDWMGKHGIQINESRLDREESMINSAIPSEKVMEIFEWIKSEDVSSVSDRIYSGIDTEVFPSSAELAQYLSVWWRVFEAATSENKGVVVQAD